jgi:hypothetical protein
METSQSRSKKGAWLLRQAPFRSSLGDCCCEIFGYVTKRNRGKARSSPAALNRKASEFPGMPRTEFVHGCFVGDFTAASGASHNGLNYGHADHPLSYPIRY